MRAWLLAALVLVPSLAAAASPDAPRADLIVTLREGAALPPGALPVLSFHGFILPDASADDARRWAADPRVERVDRAAPLEWHEAALAARAHHALTRMDDLGGDGAGITVAVLDSGIDASHPDLVGRVVRNVKLVDGRFVPAAGDADGHGTHVAGIVGASGAASEGRYVGAAPGVELVGIDISGRFTTASAILAYDWLLANHEALGIRVVVNAWGRIGQGEAFDTRDPEIRAIDRLVREGVVVIFSASNHGPRAGTLSVEAQDPHVITVGATDAAGLLADYSSRGPVKGGEWIKPDVVAPGDAVVGPRSGQTVPSDVDPDPFHTVYSGTSQAAPHVAAIVARMLQRDPSLTPARVGEILRETAIDLGAPGPDGATGFGLVDAADALAVARGAAPDRANVLIVGGTDRYADAAELAPTARRGLLGLVERPDVVWETAFPVRAGAERLRVDAHAEGAQSLALELVKDGRTVRATEIEGPDAGVWTLRVRASIPLATRAEAVIETELPPQPARALQFDGRQPTLLPAIEDERPILDLPFAPLVTAALALVLFAVALWPARRKPASSEPASGEK